MTGLRKRTHKRTDGVSYYDFACTRCETIVPDPAQPCGNCNEKKEKAYERIKKLKGGTHENL